MGKYEREIMLESPFYREILEEGKAIGLELGREEGLREDVLEVLQVRFGVVPPDRVYLFIEEEGRL